MWFDGLPIRGGNWNNGVNARVFALNLADVRSSANTNIGFRPALGEGQKLGPHGVSSSAPSKGPAILGQVPKNNNGPGRDSNRRNGGDPSLRPIMSYGGC